MTLTLSLRYYPYHTSYQVGPTTISCWYAMSMCSAWVSRLDRCLVAKIIPGRSFPASAAWETIHEGGIKQPGSWWGCVCKSLRRGGLCERLRRRRKAHSTRPQHQPLHCELWGGRHTLAGGEPVTQCNAYGGLPLPLTRTSPFLKSEHLGEGSDFLVAGLLPWAPFLPAGGWLLTRSFHL